MPGDLTWQPGSALFRRYECGPFTGSSSGALLTDSRDRNQIADRLPPPRRRCVGFDAEHIAYGLPPPHGAHDWRDIPGRPAGGDWGVGSRHEERGLGTGVGGAANHAGAKDQGYQGTLEKHWTMSPCCRLRVGFRGLEGRGLGPIHAASSNVRGSPLTNPEARRDQAWVGVICAALAAPPYQQQRDRDGPPISAPLQLQRSPSAGDII